MRQVLLVTGGAVLAVSAIVVLFTFSRVNEEKVELTSLLHSRGQVLADSLAERIGPVYQAQEADALRSTIDTFAENERLAGVSVFDNSGMPLALSENAPSPVGERFVSGVMDAGEPRGDFIRQGSETLYTYALPLREEERVVGALVVAQSATHVGERVRMIWLDNVVRLFLQILLFGIVVFVLVQWVFVRSVSHLAESLRRVRRGDEEADVPHYTGFLKPLAGEISKMTQSLRHARRVASEEARMRLEKLDSPWTAERLSEFIKAHLKERELFVLSNGEPYVNTRVKNAIEWRTPAGGVVTAIEPVMEACGGMWIAHGSGSADKETADEEGKVQVPPDEPKYTLKRVWLSPKEVKGYYDGFANGAIWPLCHTAHVRPEFQKEDWKEYRKVNGLFAKTVLAEVRHIERPVILVQDYHLALVPEMIKKSRPDALVALFWHIPWPSAAQFSICPWRKELLEGILGADLIGFHTQQFCNNFMDTAANEIEARIDYEHFSIVRNEHQSFIKPFPISIAFPGSAEPSDEPDRSVLEKLGIRSEHLALGVDRLDYIKGIPERFRAVEFLLEAHPEHRGTFTFLQIASPTREAMEKYREHRDFVVAEAERINVRFGTRDWKPIVVEERSYSHGELRNLYQLADACLVTSLHDGMNLVAKEFIAARRDEAGSLILSQFTGASRGIKGAFVVNPYSAEETAAALHESLTMPRSEQHRRMKAMRASVRGYNIYRWSAELIRELLQLE